MRCFPLRQPKSLATHPYLFNSWLVKPEVKAMICQRSYFGMIPVIAHSNNRDLRFFNECNQLLNSSSVFISRHSVNFIHDQCVPGACPTSSYKRVCPFSKTIFSHISFITLTNIFLQMFSMTQMYC